MVNQTPRAGRPHLLNERRCHKHGHTSGSERGDPFLCAVATENRSVVTHELPHDAAQGVLGILGQLVSLRDHHPCTSVTTHEPMLFEPLPLMARCLRKSSWVVSAVSLSSPRIFDSSLLPTSGSHARNGGSPHLGWPQCGTCWIVWTARSSPLMPSEAHERCAGTPRHPTPNRPRVDLKM